LSNDDGLLVDQSEEQGKQLPLGRGTNMQTFSLNDHHERVPPLAPNVEPPLHAPPRSPHVLASDVPSSGRRIIRAAGRYLLAVLIGVSATLAWQAYGDEGKQLLIARVPSLGWLLPVSPKSPSDGVVAAQNPVVPQPMPIAHAGETSAAVSSQELVQQLQPVVNDLAIVRHSLEQLAGKQDQIAQSIATLQAAEQDIQQKISTPPAPRPAPPRKPPQPVAQSSAAQSGSVPSPAPSAQKPLAVH
jgi:hypothetical protein